MTFNVRPLEGSGGDRWQWMVYSFPEGTFLRDGQITGDREKAGRAARAAIMLMGGVAHE